MQTACARALEVLAGAPLDNGNVDARKRQLGRQHQPRRTASGDHHCVLCRGRTARGSVVHLRSSLLRVSRLRPGTVRHDPGLAASPWVWHTVEVERGGGRSPRIATVRAPRWRLASTIADQGLSPSRNLATPSSRIGGSPALSAANNHVFASAPAPARKSGVYGNS